jgi:hypothetical protein
MADFMKNKAKLIFIIYGIIIALIILGAIIYMSFVTNVHIAYTINDNTGAIEFFDESLFQSTGGDNTALFSYFNNNSDATSPFYAADFAKNFEVVDEGGHNILYYGKDGVSFARTIFNFQVNMSSFNTTLLVFGIISLVCFAIMLIFSNQSRRVYYKSNLYIGVLMPLVNAVLSIVALIMNFGLFGEFNKNYDLYRVTAYLQDPNISKIVKGGLKSNYSVLSNGVDQFGPQGYVILTIILAIVIIASVFMIVYSVYRYKECAKHRNDILERAANNQ